MKKRVTIYIDEGVWRLGKDAAWELRESFSLLVENAIKMLVGVKGQIVNNQKELLIPDTGNQDLDVSDIEMCETEILAEGQAKLDEVRKKRDIKKDKIAKVKDSGFFKPQPKGAK